MKAFFFLFAMMLFSINLYSAPPDSCLWVPEHPIEPIFSDENWFNTTPTVKIDTCGLYDINPNYYWHFPNSPDTLGKYYIGYPNIGSYKDYFAQKRFYSKSLWRIKMSWSVFDTTGKDLNTMNYFTVDDIDSINNQEIFQSFKQVRQAFGNFKFWFNLDKNISIHDAWILFDNSGDSEYIEGDYLYIGCDNFVNSAEFAEFINTIVPNVECKYRTIFSLPTSSVNENPKTMFTIKLSADYNSLSVESNDILRKIIIYSFTSNKLMELQTITNGTNNIQISISHLLTGVYFIQINNSFHKFMVVR